MWEWVESSRLFLTLALIGSEELPSLFGRLLWEKELQVSIAWQVEWASDPVWTQWRIEEFLILPVFEPRSSFHCTIQVHDGDFHDF
jgi:hypothetical protein